MTITASGIGSGIDILGLVDQLVEAERARPEQLLNDRESTLNSQISAIGQLRSSLSTFQDSLSNLSTSANFRVFSGSSSNEDVATITADETARAGSFVVSVDTGAGDRLASANKLITNSGFADTNTAEVGTGNVTISNGNGGSFSLNFAGGGDNTLDEIRDAINNSEDNFGVTATVITVDNAGTPESKLILTADETGADNTLTVTTDASISALASANQTEITPGLDARFTIDGQTVTSATNTVTGAISGITINLTGEGTSTIAIATDEESIIENVQAFVDSFNELQATFNATSGFNEENPTPLFSDSTVQSIISRIRTARTAEVASATSSFNTLTSIGITTNDDGTLSLDSGRLTTALNNDFESVSTLFSAEDGVGQRLDGVIEEFTQFAGLLDSKTDSLNSRISIIDDARERLDFRIVRLEERLQAQFIAMDILVQSLNSTGSFLTQQLANLPGFTRDQ